MCPLSPTTGSRRQNEAELHRQRYIQKLYLSRFVIKSVCMPLQGTGLFSGISLSLNGTPSSATSTTTLPAQSTTVLSPPRTIDSKYLEQLRSLNVSVSEWIAKHVQDNPFVDLTPIFRDYETHLKNIDNKVSKDEGMDCSTDLGSFGYNHLSSLLPPFLLSSLLPPFLPPLLSPLSSLPSSSLLPPFLPPRHHQLL